MLRVAPMVPPPAPSALKLTQIKAQSQRQKPAKKPPRKQEVGPPISGSASPTKKSPTKEKSPTPQPSGPIEKEPWSWTTLVDTVPTNHPAVFTKDSKYFFQPSGSTVKVYSTVTGQVVSTLSTPLHEPVSSGSKTPPTHHTQPITSVVLNPNNPFQIFTASLDGQVKIWDFLEPVLLKSINVGNPITHMCAHESLEGYVFVATSLPSKTKAGNSRKPTSLVLRVSLNDNLRIQSEDTDERPPPVYIYVGKTKALTALAISPNGTWLVGTGGQKAHVANTSSLSEGFTKFVSTDALTCLAFHPTEEYFATGDTRGQVRLWYCLNDGQLSFEKLGAEKKAVTTALHWHAHPVQSVAFTPNGAYLLSGGEESVLVLWQLETGHKEFVPRMGSPIRSISIVQTEAKGQEYLLGLSDGTLSFVSAASLKISRSTTRLKLNPGSQDIVHDFFRPFPSPDPPLAVHPEKHHILLPSSHLSSLQVYTPYTSSLIAELEITPTNRITGPNSHSPMVPVKVTHAAVSPRGGWLATVDVREETVDFGCDVVLKLWKWEDAANTYVLNTRIDRPHGKERVRFVCFGPGSGDKKSPVLVTGAADGNVKLWGTRTSGSTKKGTLEEFWVPRSSFGYRGKNPTCASFSADGSVLAVALGSFVTLWDLASNALLHVFTNLALKSISEVAFVSDSGRYLAVVGAMRDVILWDIVTGRVAWHIPTARHISHLIPLPKSDLFAAFVPTQAGTEVLILSPASWKPVRIWTLDFQLRQVASFASVFPRGFSLVGITHDYCVVMVGDDVSLPVNEGLKSNNLAGDGDAPRLSLFESIFGPSAFKDLDGSEDGIERLALPKDDAAWNGKGAGIDMRLLDGPAYLLPPIGTLFKSLMSGVLREVDTKEEEQVEQAKPDDEMDVDEPETILVSKTGLPSRVSERVVTEQEIGLFTQLFKEHVTISTSASHTNGNGTSASSTPVPPSPTHSKKSRKPGHKSKKAVNGSVTLPEQEPSPMEETTPTPSIISPSGSAIMIGQKRKQASP